MTVPFYKADILIPKKIDISKWSVIACDQYTQDKKYWKNVKDIVGDNPSTLNLILPEIYLENDISKQVKDIKKTMNKYLKDDLFSEYKDSMIYVEREQSNGKTREGLIGIVDLEEYSFEKDSKALIKATEETVIERIPPRVKIRENASLELPHIMVLIDDKEKKIIESIKYEAQEKLYDFDLMNNSGNIKGYLLNDKIIDRVLKELEELSNNVDLLFAVGDGNHSLATAKTCYEKLKKKLSKEEYLNHPARYALVELVNLHSDALEFEAIHRVLLDVDQEDFLNELSKYYKINEDGIGQKIKIVTNSMEKDLYIENPKSNIPVGSIQIFLDEYLKNKKTKIDYIHGEEYAKELAKRNCNLSIILEPISKDKLFETITLDGALPRKTFSMGQSDDKRFYLEARKIK